MDSVVLVPFGALYTTVVGGGLLEARGVRCSVGIYDSQDSVPGLWATRAAQHAFAPSTTAIIQWAW